MRWNCGCSTPDDVAANWKRRLAGLLDQPIDDVPKLLTAIQVLERAGESVVVYPDAEEWIQQRLHDRNIAGLVSEIRKNPAKHALRTELLKEPLLPYQLDGIAFAVGAGRAVLADDMGLGKTIQGIGVAELLSRVAGVQRVLVVCPTSLKAQWASEVQRFCDRDCQLVMGSAEERFLQYDNGCFFTICNYEQVLRDLEPIEQVKWDLIILDEGQRIKNWEAKTSRVIKSLRSRFALVLSGTPLENRLDELYSVVQFIDDRRLGPGFRFFHRHRVVDEKGKVTGYKNLDELRANLQPVLLRRTRASVLQQLPERTTEIVRIPASDEQAELSKENVKRAAQIASKRFLTEMDLIRIQQHLLVARMAANSTFLVNKQEPAFSTKLEYLDDLFEQLWQQPDRKVVAVLRVDHDARSDRTAAGAICDRLRPARRLGSPAETPAVGPPIPEDADLSAVHDDECRVDRPESAGGQHGDQCRSAVESRRAGAADFARPSHGTETSGRCVSAGDRRHVRGTPVEHAGRQTRSGTGGVGSRIGRHAAEDAQQHGRPQAAAREPDRRAAGGVGRSNAASGRWSRKRTNWRPANNAWPPPAAR